MCIISTSPHPGEMYGARPTNISYRMQPSAYTSVEPSTSSLRPRHCSGDMYAGVPKMTPVRVFGPSLPPQSGRSFAIPKSSTLTRSPPGDIGSGTRNRFSGLRSRCTISMRVRRRNRARRLDRDVDRLADAEPFAGQAARQRLALQELHHDVRDFVVDHPDVDHLDHVRVMDGGGGARLVHEARDQAGAFQILALEQLYRDAAAQYRVLRQVDNAHRAVAHELSQLVIVNFLTDHRGGAGILAPAARPHHRAGRRSTVLCVASDPSDRRRRRSARTAGPAGMSA